jgi:hypothetical protein
MTAVGRRLSFFQTTKLAHSRSDKYTREGAPLHLVRADNAEGELPARNVEVGRMVTVEQGRSEEAITEEQIHTAFLCVITHQGHGTRDDGEQRRDGLKQGVELGVAEPGGTVQGETAEKKHYAEKGIDQASPHDSIRFQSHPERLSADWCCGIRLLTLRFRGAQGGSRSLVL